MSSYSQSIRIINKKVVGKKLLYLVVCPTSKRWIDYEQLTEYLPYVIDYEKSLNPSIMARGTLKEKMLERVQ